MGELLPRVRATVERFRMLSPGQRVLVAVSGGADSVALLHALDRLRRDYDLALHVVHVNHHLRPEAGEDAAFVLRLTGRLGLPVTVTHLDPARPRGESPEAWARRERYGAVLAVLQEVGAQRVALGHTADDQAETVLMRLLQGAGPRGLAGVPPVRGPVIRPFIEVDRGLVLAFLRGIGAEWVEDRSNRDLRYLRNRLRLGLLPDLAQYNPQVRGALRRVAEHCREVSEALGEIGARLRKGCARGERFARPGTSPSGAVLKEALRQWVESLTGRPLRQHHLDALGRLAAAGRTQGLVRLPGGAVVTCHGSELIFQRDIPRHGRPLDHPAALPLTPIEVPGSTELPGSGLVIEAALAPREGVVLSQDSWSVVFDWDRLPQPLEVRTRLPGDRFRPFGFDGTKSLKKFFNEAHIPRGERDHLPLLTARGEIVWVVGHRRGASAPVGPDSLHLLVLRARPTGAPRVG